MAKKLSKKAQIVTKRKFIEAYGATLGNITQSAKSAGVNRNMYYDWIESDPEFSQACDNILEEKIDFVENSLLKLIKDGKEASTIFFMKTYGKKRGYGEKLEIEGNIENTLKIIRLDIPDEITEQRRIDNKGDDSIHKES